MTINSNFHAETPIQKNNDALIKAIEALTSSQLDRSDSATHPPSSVSDQKKDKNKKQPRAEPRTAAANSTPRSTIPKAKNDRNKNGGNDAVESPSTVAVIGDSITKSIIGSKLAANRKVKSYSFPGATIEDIGDHIKPVLRRKPKHITVHIGTNNLRADKLKTIKKKMVSLISDVKQHDKNVKIALSSITHRNDRHPNSAQQVNKLLHGFCVSNNIDFINKANVGDDCLSRDGLHLNPKGVFTLVTNFTDYISQI